LAPINQRSIGPRSTFGDFIPSAYQRAACGKNRESLDPGQICPISDGRGFAWSRDADGGGVDYLTTGACAAAERCGRRHLSHDHDFNRKHRNSKWIFQAMASFRIWLGKS
jgi:hypothetical protein